MKEMEKLSKETQDRKTDHQLIGKNGKIKKQSEKFQTSSQFGKKLPFESRHETIKDNCIGNALKSTSTNIEKEKLPLSTNYQTGRTAMGKVLLPKAATILSSAVLRQQQAIKLNDQLVPVTENDNQRYEERLNKPASSYEERNPSEKMIISEGGNQMSGNILLKKNIKDSPGVSSMQICIGKPMNNTTRGLDKALISENELIMNYGYMKGISPATRKVSSKDHEDLLGKICLSASFVSDGTVAASPMSSGISTNSHSGVIFRNNVELLKQDKVSKTYGYNPIHEKGHAIESTSQSSTGKRKVHWWDMDYSNTTRTAKSAKTSVITNTHGSEDKVQIDAPIGLSSSSDEFKSSVMVSNFQPADSSKERDFLSSFGGTSGYLTLRADAQNINNSFSGETSLSAAPPVPKVRDFLNSFGANHSSSGSWPTPPPVVAANMNTENSDCLLGFAQQPAGRGFTVSRHSSFAPYNKQTVVGNNNNNPIPLNSTHTFAVNSRPGSYDATPANPIPLNSTPLCNNSRIIHASSIVPNSSAPSRSSRPNQVYWGNPCPLFLMVFGRSLIW